MQTTSIDIEAIAKVAHEANRAYCQTIGDNSQVPWEDVHGWQRESAVDGVKNIIDGKVRHPQDSHVSWMTQKEADGWVYGETKDPEAKTHPCMVDFHDLPIEQQRKDHLFFGVVKALIALE